MAAPRAWTTETLMKRINQFVEGRDGLTEMSTVADLFDELENTIVFEKTGVTRRKRETSIPADMADPVLDGGSRF